MNKFILDANMSPETARYLREKFGFDVTDAISEGIFDLKDEQLVDLIKRQKRIIITFDLDFGEIYYLREPGKMGVIVLRLEDQTVESTNKILDSFFSSNIEDINLNRSLVIIEENKIRIIQN